MLSRRKLFARIVAVLDSYRILLNWILWWISVLKIWCGNESYKVKFCQNIVMSWSSNFKYNLQGNNVLNQIVVWSNIIEMLFLSFKYRHSIFIKCRALVPTIGILWKKIRHGKISGRIAFSTIIAFLMISSIVAIFSIFTTL